MLTYHINHEQREHGFTLAELLVVILIIGVLAAVAVPAFLNQRSAAQESVLKSDIKNAGTILEGQGKFDGRLPDDLKTSDGVVLTAMRMSDRDNKVVSSQFVDGKSPQWGSYRRDARAATIKTEVFTDANDGYKGMNYRRVTHTGGETMVMGHTTNIDVPELVKTGDQYTVGVAVRQNYVGSRSLHIEFKNGSGNDFPGGISTKTLNLNEEWQYFTFTGTARGDGSNRIHLSLYATMSPGQSVDVTGAVIVKGDKVDPQAALDMTGNDFCVQGYHQSKPENIWRWSSLEGGLQNGKC